MLECLVVNNITRNICNQTTFADVLSQLVEKLKHSADLQPSSHLGLFVPDQQESKSGIWLNPNSSIEEYVNEGIIKSGVRDNQLVKLVPRSDKTKSLIYFYIPDLYT